MNRKSLIISAAYDDPNIPNVSNDAILWLRFLKSNLGGAWQDEEIIELEDPTKEEVQEAIINLKSEDYTFIVFIGHGAEIKSTLPWSETALYLRGDDYITKTDINPGTIRCTLVLDCCRGKETSIGISKKAGDNLLLEAYNKVIYRSEFVNQLQKSEKGLVVIYAASYDEAASDTWSFSKCLIYALQKWSSEYYGVINQPQAIEIATAILRKHTCQQTPEYNGGRRRHHFPIALNLK
jgi:hypothetical protein